MEKYMSSGMKIVMINRNPFSNTLSMKVISDILFEKISQTNEVVEFYAPCGRAHIHSVLKNLIKIKKFIKKNANADIYHVTGDIHYAALVLPKGKSVVTVHDIMPIAFEKNKIKRWLLLLFWYKLPLRHCGRIVAISEKTKESLEEIYPRIKGRITVINDPISDVYKYRNKCFNSAEPIIISVGTSERKNIKRLIEALEGIQCKLIIVGALSEEFRNLLNRYKIKYQNFFNVSNEKLADLYNQADICYFASLYEGFGVVPVEAQAMGTCVITSDLEPHKTVSGKAAIYVNPYETSQIRDAIIKLITDSKTRRELVEQGFCNAEKYRADIIANQYINLYQSLFESGK